MSKERESQVNKKLWSNGDEYESYTGHLSRKVAPKFLDWLSEPKQGLNWCDLCSGTGALTSTILDLRNPASIDAVDASPAYLAYAKKRSRISELNFIQKILKN